MEAIEEGGVALPTDALPDFLRTATDKTALCVGPDEKYRKARSRIAATVGAMKKLSRKWSRIDRRAFYLSGMLLFILYPIVALWVITYKECPLDEVGNPIQDYEPPEPCATNAQGEKEDPNCIDPPEAYVRVENICYLYLANEFAMHVTYVLYVKVWTLGGRTIGVWRELAGFAVYFIVEFLINAAPYHVQTFPAVRKVLPFFNNFTWPLWAAFIFGSILLIPLGVFLSRTRDQARRALIFHLPGIVFFGVDVFNRTVFLPFFETMQHKFAQLELHDLVTFIGELVLSNFYGSIFLPATHKLTNVLAEFGYNVSYLKHEDEPTEEDTPEDLLQQDSEDGVRVLLELDGSSSRDSWKQTSTDATQGPTVDGYENQNTQGKMLLSARGDYSFLQGAERSSPKEEVFQQPSVNRSAFSNHDEGKSVIGQQSRGLSRLGSRASAFTSATHKSRILAPIVAPAECIPPRGQHVPIRPDGPDPLEFDKILCWLAIVWDAWRYLLIRTVLMKASSIWLYLIMIIKDFTFSYWHFGYSFTERRILTVIEGVSTEDNSLSYRIKKCLSTAFNLIVVRPFFLCKFLSTTVWRTEIIFGMNAKRQNYSQAVYEDSSRESGSQRVSFRQTMRHAGGRKPTASDWAMAFSTVAAEKGRTTRGFVGELFSDIWSQFVLNARRDWRHWKAKDFSRYKHPIEHWRKRLESTKLQQKDFESQGKSKTDELEVRYVFANECVIIRNVPPKPKTPKSRSFSKILSKEEETFRPSGQSVFRRINAAWLSEVVKEIQSLIFNRSWPRLLQKFMSSSVLLATELYAHNTIVSLLPSYQQVRRRDNSLHARVLEKFKSHSTKLAPGTNCPLRPCSLELAVVEFACERILVSRVVLMCSLPGTNCVSQRFLSVRVQFGLFRDKMGRFRVIFMFSIDIVEVVSICYTQAQSRFYQSIRRGYNLFHDWTMICLCIFNCAAQILNFAMLRYIRFAPICGDKRVLPDDVKQDLLKNLNLVKYWDQPDS